MLKEILAFENEVIQIVKAKLEEDADAFQKVGLIPQMPELHRLKTDPSTYQSEIAVYFYDENGFFDVLEFFVYRNGKPNANREEIERWLGETIGDILKRKQKKGS